MAPTFEFDRANPEQREQMAAFLEQKAALLRRGEFTPDLWLSISEGLDGRWQDVNVRLRHDFKQRPAWAETWDEYRGRESDTTYESKFVHAPDGRDRRAHAYLNAHNPESGNWFLRIHERNDSHLRERWVGGRVLTNPDGRGSRVFTRDEAITAADTWAHHGELPENAIAER